MDRKRVNGPEQSVAPIFKNQVNSTAILNDNNTRLDGRSVEDVRPICTFTVYLQSEKADTDPQEKEYSQILCQALAPSVRLELLPKSAIDIYVNVLENDGTSSCLAAAIVASSVALADAGIEMLDQIFANQQILMDGTEAEEEQKEGCIVVSYMPSLNEVTHILQSGQSEVATTSQAIEQCIDGCSKIYSVMSCSLLQSLENKQTA
ncbi:Exosome complex component MTR3 [Apophysomyces ossiformis]|uniref:Exosome complex component MTR3 n=1 Tax=Apophysomyces ossiformis TaxID=679940 RepID=A0A8H7EP57_9FUNG|nr:Exosome complex component MTR3 [Apophysomyces ossiformis]